VNISAKYLRQSLPKAIPATKNESGAAKGNAALKEIRLRSVLGDEG
jgi:hypothetical protein